MNRWSFFFLLLLFVGCSSEKQDVYMHSVNGVWEKKIPQVYEIEIKDYKTPKNLIFVVRNNNKFQYLNLNARVCINDGNKELFPCDNLKFNLAELNGLWKGHGFGDTKEMLFLYKVNAQFPKDGKYIVEINHLMPVDLLIGIEDIGIIIETPRSK